MEGRARMNHESVDGDVIPEAGKSGFPALKIRRSKYMITQI